MNSSTITVHTPCAGQRAISVGRDQDSYRARLVVRCALWQVYHRGIPVGEPVKPRQVEFLVRAHLRGEV